ncbi:MAG: hypothetical protein Q8J76_02155 [Desulfobulbaceae bacterium]|nr:hypothetical protein [Desulfobulbaceae bacterium]
MPVVRLAKLEDYEAFDLLGRAMYRIRWHEQMCPGNPTDDPSEGLPLFNEWQCTVAAGKQDQLDPGARLDLITAWCISNNTAEAALLAVEILNKYKGNDSNISLEFNASDFSEPALGFRYELAFLNSYVSKLPASVIMQLQNICKGGDQ